VTEPRPSLEQLLDLAEEALDAGELERAASLCRDVLAVASDHPGAHFLIAEAQREVRNASGAEASYRKVIAIESGHSPSWSGLATVLFDTLRFDEAGSCVNRALRLAPDNAEAHYTRALLRERRGDMLGAERDYVRAQQLDPDQYPLPIELSDALVEAVVEAALRDMHPAIRQYLANVPIVLEEVPDDDTCGQWDPPMPPAEILGYFAGPSLMDRSLDDPWSQLPPTIRLFRRNLSRIAQDHDHLVEELRVTLLHEVGHLLGLDEDDLEARGLD
jgi:predicted Zn-dependent protease with MMP-like domain